MRRLAVRSALSVKFADQQVKFVDGFEFATPRTKDMLVCLSALNATGKTLIVLPGRNEVVTKSINNIPGVKTLPAHYLNVVDLLTYDNVIIAQPAVAVMESYLSSPAHVDGEDA